MAESPNLIRRFHAGESQAFAELISEHKDDVYTLCLRMLGPETAESATESIFLQAHQAMHRLDTETDLHMWILQRTVHHTTEAKNDPDEESLTEKSALAQRLLNELEPTFRVAVILRDVLRLSEDEIATILALPIGTARSRIHRGRLTLGRNFSPHLDRI
jgi:RNA polymerase sigma-70 factor (ECF subfamily)